MLIGGVPIYVGALLFEDFGKLADVGLTSALGAAYNVLLAFAWAHWAWIKLATSVSVTRLLALACWSFRWWACSAACCSSASSPAGPSTPRSRFVLGSLATVIVPQRRAA